MGPGTESGEFPFSSMGGPHPEDAAPTEKPREAAEAPSDPDPFELQRRIRRTIHDLEGRRFARALKEVETLRPDLGPAAGALRAWALAGLGRLEEAQEDLSEARLHPGAIPCLWEPIVRSAAEVLAEGRARERATRRPRRPEPPSRPAPRPAAPARPPPKPVLPDAHVDLRFVLRRGEDADLAADRPADPTLALVDHRLRREAIGLERLRRFDTLLALASARGVDHYEYQLRTVRRVLREFRGRALLADEVGLGKTVEACLCLEEYLLRGLVRRALLLVPPGLLAQWRDELRGKFGREAVIVDGALAREDPDVWEREPLLIASMALARTEPHAQRLLRARFDMVVVDEAHRLKNRRTRIWQLVDRLRSRFLLLLSATPVENDLVEIYNVLSLLRPGLLSTPADFQRTYVAAGGRRPKDPARLRSLLRRVMIRNTRALSEARLPPRFATTLRAAPTPEEAAFYADLATSVRAGIAAGTLAPFAAGEILRAAGSRPPAAAPLLARHLGPALAERARALSTTGKTAVLLDLLSHRPDDKVILFAGQRETLDHLVEVARAAGRRPVLFHGSLDAARKAGAVAEFAGEADVLVASESGGEGFNLHFARTIVNYDLPWNPMRIEQRIGRVHRIGQTRDVFVFNLVAAGTVEEEVLRVLDEKVNMFELVVGEVEAILGRLGDDEKEFADLVLEMYAEAKDAEEVRARFDALAERMLGAKREHLRVREIEDEVFARELEA